MLDKLTDLNWTGNGNQQVLGARHGNKVLLIFVVDDHISIEFRSESSWWGSLKLNELSFDELKTVLAFFIALVANGRPVCLYNQSYLYSSVRSLLESLGYV